MGRRAARLEIYSGQTRSWERRCVAWVAWQVRSGRQPSMQIHRLGWGRDGSRYPIMRSWRSDPITVMAVRQELARCGHPGCSDCDGIPGGLQPTASAASLVMAEACLQAQDHAKVIRLLTDLSEEWHAPPDWWPLPHRARFLEALGDALRHSGRPAAASPCYSQLLVLEAELGEPSAGLANTWGRLAMSRAESGDAPGAEAAFAACVELAGGLPHHGWGYHYGVWLGRRGAWSQARAALLLSRATASPDHPRIRGALLWATLQELLARTASNGGSGPAEPGAQHRLVHETISQLRAIYTARDNPVGLDIVSRGEALERVLQGRFSEAVAGLRAHIGPRAPSSHLAHVWWALAEGLRALGGTATARPAYAILVEWGADGNARLAQRSAAILAAPSEPPPALRAAPGRIAVRIQAGDRVLVSIEHPPSSPITIGPAEASSLTVRDPAWQLGSVVLTAAPAGGWRLAWPGQRGAEAPDRVGSVALGGGLLVRWVHAV